MTDDIDIHAYLAERHIIGHLWSTEDVLEVRPDLTEDQAWEVLQYVDRRKDCDLGISWQTIEIFAEELFPEPDSAKERLRNRLQGLLRQVDALPGGNPGVCVEIADKLDDLERQVREEGGAA